MKLLVVCGPTASGKTALAVECARRLGGEIVSCDALLVYRGLNVGTAKPTEEEMRGVPHHLIDVVSPLGSFSVSDFSSLALQAIDEISARGHVPVLCGGTGFYLNAVLFPAALGGTPSDPSLREKFEAIASSEGKEALHAMLREVDPESAEKLHPNDVKRVIRALEIYHVTGRKKSDQHDEKIPRFPYTAVSFQFPREELYARIERRVDGMMRMGLVEEVRGLLADGVPSRAQCMQGIGYKEVVDGLEAGASEEEISACIKQNTRNYAKRQLTFFKKMPELHLLSPKGTEEAAEEVIRLYECR